MLKKAVALLLAVAAMFSVSGCSSLLEGDTDKVTVHQVSAGARTENAADAEVSTEAELEEVLLGFIREHKMSGLVDFKNYSGDVENDVYIACMNVSNNTPLGSYAVYYISNNVSRYVTYYQAEIHITYKKSADEVAKVVDVYSSDTVRALIKNVMSGLGSSLVMNTSLSALDDDYVQEYIHSLYYSDPSLIVTIPKAAVSFYPETGTSQIADISFSYSDDSTSLNQKRSEMLSVARQTAAKIQAESDEEKVLEACLLLSEISDFDAELDAEGENGQDSWNQEYTAYGALVGGKATSEGFAMAFKLLCDLSDIPCQVVIGRRDDVNYAWNIVKIGDSYYHFDVSLFDETGSGDGTLFLRDQDVSDTYWWETDSYPQCEGGLTFGEVQSGLNATEFLDTATR